MTPFEFGCYSRRLWHIEKINVRLRDICFSEGIVDQLPDHKIASMDKSFESLYTPFYLDREIIRWQPSQQNKALRWRLLRESIFDQLNLSEKNPEIDPLLIVMRRIAAEKVKQLVEPFKAAGAATRELNAEIEDVMRAARRVLLHDSSANTLFTISRTKAPDSHCCCTRNSSARPKKSTSAAPPTQMRLRIASA
ncbi:hypothetical protein TGAM01_v202922 [Trichoderma gamsii]|uniref:Uncharacterized protein n=1 Tax=Trichoderma gamsii TaxID=398673 RepID=A0A2P4ZVY6_9HYPO|nr:hypothetical protein TGAM01_v202922 [Trichoderma gamsii]PON28428.1 hypothetical protein TGAM01_v202922 [Trichoderma gamsii]